MVSLLNTQIRNSFNILQIGTQNMYQGLVSFSRLQVAYVPNKGFHCFVLKHTVQVTSCRTSVCSVQIVTCELFHCMYLHKAVILYIYKSLCFSLSLKFLKSWNAFRFQYSEFMTKCRDPFTGGAQCFIIQTQFFLSQNKDKNNINICSAFFVCKRL